MSDALELVLTAGQPAARGDRLPMTLVFVNRGSEHVRLLAEFEPLQVFFAFSLVRSDGTPIGLPGGGKIDFSPRGPRYVVLAPGASLATDAELGELLPDPLVPGLYSVVATYHNQYGVDCFQGTLTSNTAVVDVPGL